MLWMTELRWWLCDPLVKDYAYADSKQKIVAPCQAATDSPYADVCTWNICAPCHNLCHVPEERICDPTA
jgi:hypothetical protein